MKQTVSVRLLALFLAVVMVVGLLPISAFATGEEQEAPGYANYTVEHRLWDAQTETYLLNETEEMSGVIGDATSAVAKTYDGYTAKAFEQGIIAAEGTTVVVIEYDVNTNGAAVEAAYTVEHQLWNAETGAFEVCETETLTGIVGELTAAAAKQYEGYVQAAEIEQVQITEDGSAVVVVYYIEDQIAVAEDDPYYNILSKKIYNLAPGATETEMILNNDDGTRRQIVHVFEVDPKNEEIEVLPGYYQIDKLDPDNLADSTYWKAMGLTKTVAYYENTLGYNVVGAMNTALAYDSDAPYDFMVYNGVVLADPANHPGGNAQTYLAIYQDGSVELRSRTEPLDGNEWQVVAANFSWLVKDGELITKTESREGEVASRSMIGIKADGTLVFCQVDGRMGTGLATGLNDYEMGEMMLSLGCVNAVNCDGGGSSTFVSKREGTNENVMRSIPSDGSERPTINSVIIVSKAQATGVFDHASLASAYDYIAPGASMAVTATGVDAGGYPVDIPDSIIWQVNDSTKGSIIDGVFTAGASTGDVTVQMVLDGKVVGEKVLHIVNPTTFGFDAESTVIPYGKSAELIVEGVYGSDNWGVCLDGAYSLAINETTTAYLTGNVLYAPSDETETGVNVTATYLPDTTVTDVITVTFGKGSEILFDFEDGSVAGWMGFNDAKQWSIDNEVANTLVGADPLAGQFSEQVSSTTFLASAANGGKVKNGAYSLAWSVDYTDAAFASWTYNVLFYVGEQIVLRDVANGNNATALGMWLYIPENAPGLAFQSQLYTDTNACKQDHFTFTTANGTVKNLNSCTEADIPESRWVYVTINLTAYDFLATPNPTDITNSRSPSIVRTYVKIAEPAVITFYIDDITLDYSSAVDDRVLPTISNVSYATADTNVALEDDAVINGNSVGFSANVSDNAGLNPATGVILVDGVAVQTTVSNGVMSCDNVILNSGNHTVTFEIQDKLGNLAKVTRDITISGDAAVTLSGHNDSGAAPEYDSVYYADINVADIANIDSLSATIYLQTANNWEPQGIQVAEGFEAEYTLNALSNELTVHVKRVGETSLTGAQTLVSLPIRVWSWQGYDSVKGAPIAPATQFASGNCPIVQIRYEIIKGEVTFVEDTDAMDVFGGKQTVVTNLNDNVNPWHYHDAELTVLNKDATCTEDGYHDRTYCETCKSVIDWGTFEAGGHVYESVEGVMTCRCGELLNGELDGDFYVDGVIAAGWVGNSYYLDGAKLTGIQKVNAPDSTDEFYYDFGEDGVCADRIKFSGMFTVEGNTYYCVVGLLKSGWQVDGEDWYYFDPVTLAAYKDGTYSVNGYNHTFDENGVNIAGQFVRTFQDGKLVTKYIFAGQFVAWKFFTIDGVEYFFHRDATMATGINMLKFARFGTYFFHEFAEDGTHLGLIDVTGIYEFEGVKYAVINGEVTPRGAFVHEDEVYFSDWQGVIQTGKFYIDQVNDVISVKGYYYFDESGKMYDDEFAVVDSEVYYMVDGQPMKQSASQVVEIDGICYFIGWNGKVSTGKVWVDTVNEHTATTGYYYFDETGRMYDKEFAVIDGTLYYLENGQPAKTGISQVVAIDGVPYFVNWNGEVSTGKVWVDNINEYIPTRGYYYFDETGRMYHKEFAVIDGNAYYLENGQPAKTGVSQVVSIDGVCYFINWNGKVSTGKVWVDTVNEYTATKGYYYFDETGRMYDGEFVLIDGATYYVVGGQPYKTGISQVVKVDGTLYFINWNGKISTGKVWVDTVNEYAPTRGYYYFDETARMYDDEFAVIEGALHYIVKGQPAKTGISQVVDVHGKLYFINWNGKVSTGKVWVDTVNEYTPTRGYYYFDETGRMYDEEFATINGELYYMVNGQTAKYSTSGIVVLDGVPHFINWNGKVSTGKVWVDTVSEYTPTKGYYYFDETGAMIDGDFYQAESALYYVVDGTPYNKGVFAVDGNLYYADWKGNVAVNTRVFVVEGETNDLIIRGWHTFDETGKMIG